VLQRLFFLSIESLDGDLAIEARRVNVDLSVRASAPSSRAAELIAVVLVTAAMGLIQVLIGGTRLLFSLPAYGLLAVLGLVTLFSLRRRKPQPSQLCLLTSAGFGGYIIARGLFSPVAYSARPDIYSMLGALLVYWFVACICTSAKQRISILLSLLVLGLVHVLIGAVQFRDGNNFMLIPFLQRFDYGRRASGFYVCPNHLAGLLEVLGIFGVSIICWSRFPVWAKMLISYATIVCYFGLVLTGSRGGYGSSAASLLVFGALSLLILRQTSSRLFWSVGGASMLAASIIALGLAFFIHRSDFLMNRAQNAFDTAPIRFDMWHAAIEQWKTRPFVGTGSGTYLYYGRMFRTDRMQMDPVDAHNDYVHLLAEYGVAGGALFVLLLVTHLHNGWKNFQGLGPKRVAITHKLKSNSLPLTIAALAAVAAYMVHSVVDFNLHIPANALLMAFVFGLLANAGIPVEQERSRVPISLFGWRLVLPVLGLILGIQCFRLLPGEYFAERARTAQRDNHPDAAAAFAARGLETERQNPFLYQYLASAEFSRCDSMSDWHDRVSCYEPATGTLEKARALAPQDRTFLVPLALAYDELGRFPEAEWIFYDARHWDPKSVYLTEVYKYHLSRWQGPRSTAQDKRATKPK
jgi:O-antigen ligase